MSESLAFEALNVPTPRLRSFLRGLGSGPRSINKLIRGRVGTSVRDVTLSSLEAGGVAEKPTSCDVFLG